MSVKYLILYKYGFASIAVSVNYAANLQSQVIHNNILEILELLDNEIKE